MFEPNFQVTLRGIEANGNVEFASREMQLQWAIYERLNAVLGHMSSPTMRGDEQEVKKPKAKT